MVREECKEIQTDEYQLSRLQNSCLPQGIQNSRSPCYAIGMNNGSLPLSSEVFDESAASTTSSANSTNASAQQQVLQNLMGNGSSQRTQAPPMHGGPQGIQTPKSTEMSQARQLLSPIALIRAASEQIFGATTPEEQQKQQQRLAKDHEAMARNKQELEAYRQKQRMGRQQQAQENAALSQQVESLRNSPSHHIGSSKTESALLQKIAQDGQAASKKQSGMRMPQSTPKGPAAQGNGAAKTDMIAAMMPEQKKSKQSEPAMIELPLGE